MRRTVTATLMGTLIFLLANTGHLAAQPTSSLSGQKHRTSRVNSWKKKLGLTDDQVQKLTTAQKMKTESLKDLLQRRAGKLRELGKLIQKKASDPEIQSLLDELAVVKKSIEDAESKFETDIGTFLSPLQQAKFELARANVGKKRRRAKQPAAPAETTPPPSQPMEAPADMPAGQ